MRRWVTEWEKIASKIHLIKKFYTKHVRSSIIRKTKNLTKDLNKHFIKEDMQMENKCMKIFHTICHYYDEIKFIFYGKTENFKCEIFYAYLGLLLPL